ncbi:MAG: hypothetical protein ACOX3S_08855 [Anaerolineae bacterium]|jgi:UDP-2,3-diacylglucosamine pyrophosphatase LpxH
MPDTKIVLSDLHLGAGPHDGHNWLEDFDQDDHFAALLGRLVDESDANGQGLELVLAGDTFDLLQVPALPLDEYAPDVTQPANVYLASSAVASRLKMGLVIAGHPTWFSALRRFISDRAPVRRVSFIKGNHDVNLHWVGVQDAIRQALDATAGRRAACVRFLERRLLRDGVYIEHGNQYLERVNCFPDFTEPHDPDNPEELYLPAGSRFVCRFFNRLERRHYWLDGAKPLTAMIWYLFALDFPLAVSALGALVREAPSLVLGSLPVTWAVTNQVEALDDIQANLANPLEMGALERQTDRRGEFYARVSDALALYGVPRGLAQAAADPNDYTALPRACAEEAAQRTRLVDVARGKVQQEDVRVVIMGHTHEACHEDLGEGRAYLNCGTWTWLRDFAGEDYQAWRRLYRFPETYTAQRKLTYVRIDYGEDGLPAPSLQTYTTSVERRSLLSWLQRPTPAEGGAAEDAGR